MKIVLNIIIIALATLILGVTIITIPSYILYTKFHKEPHYEEMKIISDFTLYENYLYFGAGYHLYRIDLSTKSLETIYTTNIIQVEKPVIADDVVYFGGAGRYFYNKQGARSFKDYFFALDLQMKKVLWKFCLEPQGSGTFGTYPAIAGEKVLVCSRRYLYCLDRANGKVLWNIANWFGGVDGQVEIPYLYKDNIYYQINALEDDPCDGSWAVASITDGKRTALIPLSEDTEGQGLGIVDNGVLYLTTRYVNRIPRNGYVGAIDLAKKKLLWEVGENFSQSRPGVNANFVFTSRWNSVVALDRQNGKVVWERNIEGITVDPGVARENYFPRLASTRIAATDRYVFVRDVKGIIALNATTGESIWSIKHEADFNPTYPIIVDGALIISNLTESSVIALDSETGAELWKVKVQDCLVYVRNGTQW